MFNAIEMEMNKVKMPHFALKDFKITARMCHNTIKRRELYRLIMKVLKYNFYLSAC